MIFQQKLGKKLFQLTSSLIKKQIENKFINKKKIFKFIINRANPKFWNSFDWFNNKFKKQDSLNFGLMDLNRYISKAINN